MGLNCTSWRYKEPRSHNAFTLVQLSVKHKRNALLNYEPILTGYLNIETLAPLTGF